MNVERFQATGYRCISRNDGSEYLRMVIIQLAAGRDGDDPPIHGLLPPINDAL